MTTSQRKSARVEPAGNRDSSRHFATSLWENGVVAKTNPRNDRDLVFLEFKTTASRTLLAKSQTKLPRIYISS